MAAERAQQRINARGMVRKLGTTPARKALQVWGGARARATAGPAHPRSGRRRLQELFTSELRPALRPQERPEAGYCEKDGVEYHDLR